MTGSDLRLNAGGEWEPIEVVSDDSYDVSEDLEQAGWGRFWRIGKPEHSPLYIEIWHRRKPQGPGRQYLLQVWDIDHGSEFVQVDGLPALMDLLADWAPVVQAASIVGIVDEGHGHELHRDGFFEKLGARLAWGGSAVLPVMEKEERARREQEELHLAEEARVRAAKRAAGTT